MTHTLDNINLVTDGLLVCNGNFARLRFLLPLHIKRSLPAVTWESIPRLTASLYRIYPVKGHTDTYISISSFQTARNMERRGSIPGIQHQARGS